MTLEHKIMNEIRLWCGQHNILCFRCNVGKVRTEAGEWFNTGLPDGFSDLMILYNKTVIFCECKTPTGKLRDCQKAFKDTVESYGYSYIIARSVEDVQKFLNIF